MNDAVPTEYRHAALSGPISSAEKRVERANLRQFQLAEGDLRREGHPAFPRWESVFSPLQLTGTVSAAIESQRLLAQGRDHTEGLEYQRLIRECYRRILGSDVVFVLPGWRDSGGACREVLYALLVGVPVWAWHPMPAHRRPLDLHAEVGLVCVEQPSLEQIAISFKVA